MERISVDVAVIGGGRMAREAYREVAAFGAKALWIETGGESHEDGRRELEENIACTLIAAARRLALLRDAASFGITPEGLQLDQARLLDRLRAIRDQHRARRAEEIAAIPDSDYRRGLEVRFVDAHTLALDEHCRIEAKAFVLVPDWVRREPKTEAPPGIRPLTLVELCQQDRLPDKAMLWGGGIQMAQLAWALAQLGIEALLAAEGNWLDPLSDPEWNALAGRLLGGAFRVLPTAELELMCREQGTAQQSVVADGERAQDRIWIEPWKPSLLPLQLTALGVSLDSRGLPNYDPINHRCGETSLFLAIKAVPGGLRPADEAMARWVARQAAGMAEPAPSGSRVPMLTYRGWPSVTLVGRRHAELDPGRFIVGSAGLRIDGLGIDELRIAEARDGRAQGMLRLYASYPDGALLGAEILGEGAEYLGQLLAWAIQQRLRLDELLDLAAGLEAEPLRQALESCREQLFRWRSPYPPEEGVLV